MSVPPSASSPAWVDAVVSIASVVLMETREFALLAVHRDGGVTAWSPQDPSVLWMRKRQMEATCVTSATETAPHCCLVWFGGFNEVRCYRARRRDGMDIHLDLLYELRVDAWTGVHALHTDGVTLVALEREMPHVFLWPAINHLATAHNPKRESARCVATRLCASACTLSSSPITCALVAEAMVWLGCTNGALVLADMCLPIERNATCPLKLRTAGAVAVRSLARLPHSSRQTRVASGMESGEIILWAARHAWALDTCAAHTCAVCALVYLPWRRQLCSVSAGGEVCFLDGCHSARGVCLAARAEWADAMGGKPLLGLCAIPDTRLVACASAITHVLRWRQNPTHTQTAHRLSHGVVAEMNETDAMEKGDGTAHSPCVVEAMRSQLALMEVLLRNYMDTTAGTRDPLLLQSTNILTDVYLIARDVLGADIAGDMTHEALEGMPFLREREVVCKLFASLCHRYRAARSSEMPRSIEEAS